MTIGVSESWIDAAVLALRAAGGRLDHVEITTAVGLRGGSGRAQKSLINALKRRGLIAWDGYKMHRYPCGRLTSRSAYRLVLEKTI